MTAEPVRLDRRQRRRLETIEEIVDVAIEVMTEYGVGGLSLGEVARRMGMRTPSLYVYFDSKNAVYDAVFARGWRSAFAAMSEPYGVVEDVEDMPAYLLWVARTWVRWTIEHPVYSQLMMWRPVPGYEPSSEAYAAAVETLDSAVRLMTVLQRRGLFRQSVSVQDLVQVWTVLLTGVMTRQLANAPHESFEDGRVTSTLPDLVAMFLAHYGNPSAQRVKGKS